MKSLGGRTIWISTADLYISTGLEPKRTNGKKKPPTLGLPPAPTAAEQRDSANPEPPPRKRQRKCFTSRPRSPSSLYYSLSPEY